MGATVVELWRYPVKSLPGEAMDEVEVEERGVVGDRLYAVTDRQGKLGSGKTSRRFRRLDGALRAPCTSCRRAAARDASRRARPRNRRPGARRVSERSLRGRASRHARRHRVPSRRRAASSAHHVVARVARDATARIADRPPPIPPEHSPRRWSRGADRGRLGGTALCARRRRHP